MEQWKKIWYDPADDMIRVEKVPPWMIYEPIVLPKASEMDSIETEPPFLRTVIALAAAGDGV
jgi:hypothetical protein